MRRVDTHWIGTHQEPVGIELIARLIAIVMKADLGVVSWKDKVVAVVVCDEGVLMAIIKGVEQAISIFFGLIKPQYVVLVLIAQAIAKESYCAVGIGENKAAKIACEKLRTRANRDKVVVRTGVCNLRFIEPLFKCPKGSVSVGTIGHIRRYHTELVNLQVVLIEDDVGFDSPIKWTKDRVAFK